MDIDKKPVTSTPYALGIATAMLTILLSYAYCFTDKGTTGIISNINIVVNLVTLFILRKYLLRFNRVTVIHSMDWYLCINAVIFLSTVFSLFLKYSGNPEFKDILEVMDFFDFLVFCTFLTIGIVLGLRLRLLPDDTRLLKPLGSMFVALVPVLFIFVSLFMHSGPLRHILPLHIALTTVAQAPLALIIRIFYMAYKEQNSIDKTDTQIA